MKTFVERLLVQIEAVTHPAGGWFKGGEAQKKRKNRKVPSAAMPSPDSFNVRGGGAKKGMHLRRTPAP